MATKKTDWAKVRAEHVHKPSQVTRRRNFLIYSRPKRGKTWFCQTANEDGKVLFLDPEHGTDVLKTKDPDVWHLENWEGVDLFYRFCRSGQHDYTWFAVDGCTKLHKMALRFVCKQAEERDLDRRPGQVTQKDYGNANELFNSFVSQMVNLPQGVIFTAQERTVGVMDFDDEGDEVTMSQFVPSLPNGARGFIMGEVDAIGRLYIQNVKMKRKGTDEVVEVPERRIYFAPHVRYDTGYRSEIQLPDFVRKPTIAKLTALIEQGSQD